jgi:hypothetical protein
MTAAAVTAVAAAGSAFTAGIAGFPATKTTGYGETAISGATAEGVTYNYSANKSTITSVVVVFTGDIDADDFAATWSSSGGVIETVAGVAGVGAATTTVTFTPAGTVNTAAVVKFGVLVTTP